MKLHVLGIPHGRASIELSHCAFSMKARRWGPMMAPLGYECVYFGAGGPPDTPGWSDYVEVMTADEQRALLGYDPLDPSPQFVGRSAHVDSPLYREFNRRLARLLDDRVSSDDWICAPFGHGHQQALTGRLLEQTIETGIGYPVAFSAYRIYESWAWMHWHLGKEQRQPWVSEWVVPNYFDPAEWPLRATLPSEGAYVLYLGRLTKEKGLNVIWQLAKARRDLTFVLCGQGDATPWLTEPNIKYVAPVHGMERAALMHGARCVLMPTEYVEPFGGVAVEAMLTGTPVLTSDHSAFPETNDCESCRCHTMGDWLAGLDGVLHRDPATLRAKALARFSLEAVGQRYNRIFQRLPAIKTRGWFAGGPEQPVDFDRIAREEAPQADRLAAWIAAQGFRRVLDVGCGPGTYTEALRRHGVEAVGVDVDERMPTGPGYQRLDLTTDALDGEYDLALCLEVAEHLPAEASDRLVHQLTGVARTVLFSAARPGQGGEGHINCQPQEHWMQRFADHGCPVDPHLTASVIVDLRSGPHMGWFTQNAFIARRVPVLTEEMAHAQ